MKGIRDIITAKHHHACNTVCGTEPPARSPSSDDSDTDGNYTDRYEEMGWELPPTTASDVHLEHYYHYPGVTLGIHRIHGYQIKYERILMTHNRGTTTKSVKIHTINVPKRLTTEEAVHLPVGDETVIVTCPEMDIAGRFVFVTVLFYKEASSPANCRCGCVQTRMAPIQEEYQGVLHRAASVPAAVTGRRVHFAPLASARYPAPPGNKEVQVGPI